MCRKPDSEFAVLGILAGSGSLPREVAEACTARGQSVFVIDLEGRASDWASAYPSARFSLGKVGGALSAMRAAGCDAVTLAGGLERPHLFSLVPDFKALTLLPKLLRLFRGGDDTVLRGVIALFEAEGFKVIAPHTLLEGVLAQDGRLAGPLPTAAQLTQLASARAILNALAPFDVGQAVVVRKDRCLAIEGPEGTAAMLARVAKIPGTGGILVKAPKTGQETRADLPSIGPDTITEAVNAGLSAIAIETGGAMILGRSETLARAEREGIALFGFAP